MGFSLISPALRSQRGADIRRRSRASGRRRNRARPAPRPGAATPQPTGTCSSSVAMPMIAWIVTSSEEQDGRRAWVVRRAAQRGDHVHRQRKANSDVGTDAVDELHRLRVLEEIDPGRLLDEEVAGHDGAIHQRPGIVAQAGIEPGDQRAEIDLEQGDAGDDASQSLRAFRRRRIVGMRRKTAPDPDAGDEDQAGNDEMGCKPVLADLGAVGQGPRTPSTSR